MYFIIADFSDSCGVVHKKVLNSFKDYSAAYKLAYETYQKFEGDSQIWFTEALHVTDALQKTVNRSPLYSSQFKNIW